MKAVDTNPDNPWWNSDIDKSKEDGTVAIFVAVGIESSREKVVFIAKSLSRTTVGTFLINGLDVNDAYKTHEKRTENL